MKALKVQHLHGVHSFYINSYGTHQPVGSRLFGFGEHGGFVYARTDSQDDPVELGYVSVFTVSEMTPEEFVFFRELNNAALPEEAYARQQFQARYKRMKEAVFAATYSHQGQGFVQPVLAGLARGAKEVAWARSHPFLTAVQTKEEEPVLKQLSIAAQSKTSDADSFLLGILSFSRIRIVEGYAGDTEGTKERNAAIEKLRALDFLTPVEGVEYRPDAGCTNLVYQANGYRLVIAVPGGTVSERRLRLIAAIKTLRKGR